MDKICRMQVHDFHQECENLFLNFLNAGKFFKRIEEIFKVCFESCLQSIITRSKHNQMGENDGNFCGTKSGADGDVKKLAAECDDFHRRLGVV